MREKFKAQQAEKRRKRRDLELSAGYAERRNRFEELKPTLELFGCTTCFFWNGQQLICDAKLLKQTDTLNCKIHTTPAEAAQIVADSQVCLYCNYALMLGCHKNHLGPVLATAITTGQKPHCQFKRSS